MGAVIDMQARQRAPLVTPGSGSYCNASPTFCSRQFATLIMDPPKMHRPV